MNDSAVLEIARRFADDHISRFSLEWEANEAFPREVLQKAAKIGFAGLYVAEEFGGSAMTLAAGVRVFEGLGYGDPSFAGYLSVHNMCARIIAQFGSEEHKSQLLPDLVAFRTQAAYCLTEAHSGSDASTMQTRCARMGDGFSITGSKSFITGAGAADLYLVFCMYDGQPVLLLVPAASAGVSVGGSEAKMGWRAQPTRQLFFSDTLVPMSALVGLPGDGLRIAYSSLDVGRLNIAAAALGAAQCSLDRTIQYSRTRVTYGQPLSHHQALRFKIAGMEMLLQSGRALLYEAAERGDSCDTSFRHYAAMAKAVVTENSCKVIDEALQLHGGYGYLADFGIEKLLRDVRVHRILEGTNEMMHVIAARTLLGREA